MFFVALAKKVKFSFQKRHNEIDHQLLFLRLGLGDHHRQCDERMVGDALRAVLAEKKLVALTVMIAESKPQEKELMVNLVMTFRK